MRLYNIRQAGSFMAKRSVPRSSDRRLILKSLDEFITCWELYSGEDSIVVAAFTLMLDVVHVVLLIGFPGFEICL